MICSKNFKIISNKQIADKIFKMEIEFNKNINILPGQFINILISDEKTSDPLLRRPISVADFDNNILAIIYQVIGKGTKILSQKKQNEDLNILYILGNSFPEVTNFDTLFLIAGGIGLPPLYFYLKKYHFNFKNIYFFYGAKNENKLFFTEKIKKYTTNLIISTEQKSNKYYQGLITDIIHKYIKDTEKILLLTCGPEGLFVSLQKIITHYPNINAFASLENYMACGYGVCNGCAQKINGEYKKVCVDGPVFNLREINFTQ